MVKLIAGKMGTGKSKQVVKRANEFLETAKGSIVFIDDDSRAMYELDHKIRFIDVSEFPIKSLTEFYGFLCGLVATNYDIEKVFIDGIMSTVEMKDNEVLEWFEKVEDLSNQFELDFIVTLNYEEELLNGLGKYLES